MSMPGVVSYLAKANPRKPKNGYVPLLPIALATHDMAPSDQCTCFPLLEPSVLDSFGGVFQSKVTLYCCDVASSQGAAYYNSSRLGIAHCDAKTYSGGTAL
jgi:hypothetical protein